MKKVSSRKPPTTLKAEDFRLRGSPDPEEYVIRVKGHFDPHWSNSFEGFTVTRTEAGETILRGPFADQAALHGLLARVRDLAVPLLEVTRVVR